MNLAQKIKNLFKLVPLVPVFFTFTTYGADTEKNPDASIVSTISESVEKQRGSVDDQAEKIRQDIASLVAATKFQEAEKEYDKLAKLYNTLGDTSYAKLKRSLLYSDKNMFYKKWADYLEDQAANAFSNKQYDKSIQLSEESISTIKKINAKMPSETAQKEIIQNARYSQMNENFASQTGIDAALPAYKYRVKDLEEYLTEAQVYMRGKEYEKAKESLEKALILDPYNYKAMTMLQSLYSNVLSVGKARSLNEAYEAIAETQWMNNEAVLPNVAVTKQELKVIEAESDAMGDMKEKLDTIIIPKIDFEDASLSSVLTYLSRESKIADEDGKGINIIYRKSNNVQEPKSVTMQLDDVPIGEIIRYICLSSGMKYRIEEDAVIVGDDSIDEIETRFFQIKSGLINSIVSNLNVEDKKIGTNEKNFYDTKAMLTTSVIKDQRVIASELRNYFLQRGVPFPPGSSIAWDSKTSTLIVTNTPENLRIAESLIKDIDVDIPLVLIEAKFVEINHSELEEIAFKWKVKYKAGNTTINPNAAGTESVGNDAIIQHYQAPGGSSAAYTDYGALINDLQISYNNFTLQFWMYALDQSKTVEILSSPKVITKSGSKALIRMVTEQYFPNDWTEPQPPTGDVNSTTTFSGPNFTDPTDLGITLSVTPTVSPNNHTILLDINPQVVDFVGWDDYSYSIAQTDNTSPDTPLVITAPVLMAQISHRDVNTKVKVYDGETIVLGGTIKEEAYYVDDIMPFLGEIPVVGRLFRSKYQDIKKTNLLVFVSARLINPDGTPFREQSNKFFDFER